MYLLFFLYVSAGYGQRSVWISPKDFPNPNCQRPRSGSSTACFKVVREPFVQLLSGHSFMKSGNSMQQVLLCFVLMSLRRTTVFDGIPALLDEQPSVRDRHRFREAGMEHLAPMSTSCVSPRVLVSLGAGSIQEGLYIKIEIYITYIISINRSINLLLLTYMHFNIEKKLIILLQ